MDKDLLDNFNHYDEKWKQRNRKNYERESTLRQRAIINNELIKDNREIRMLYGDKPIPQALCYGDDLPFDILPYESRIDDGVPYEQRIRKTSSNLTLIDKLHNTGKEENLINAFKSAFGDIRACYSFKGHYQGELVLRKEISSGVVVRAFYLRDNDCVPTSHTCNIDYRSQIEFPDEIVKKVYFSFMAKEFPEFKEKHTTTNQNIGDGEAEERTL